MRFKKDDVIEIPHDLYKYQCIVCDDDTAVFATRLKTEYGSKVLYDDLFAVSNHEGEDGFRYEIVNG